MNLEDPTILLQDISDRPSVWLEASEMSSESVRQERDRQGILILLTTRLPW